MILLIIHNKINKIYKILIKSIILLVKILLKKIPLYIGKNNQKTIGNN